ncbi:glutathione S-transferase family protein [Marinibaculum pumilum]|uniref:Glutathione S-transferase family protein n=1 Tax=Marinibaculum pumilum TaxID=1766165 RepID=A0ABV7L0S6_9PROT
MILIGMYDSPFVRRVAIAMRLYGMDYEHRPWSTFGDADRIADYSPLLRVPVLVLDDGEVLIESAAILDWLDEQAGDERALIAANGAARRRALKVCALATGLADKAVSLIYERAIHGRDTEVWQTRCRRQIRGALDSLEAVRAATPGTWLFGGDIGHADIAIACALRLLGEAHPGAFDMAAWPALARHAAACEALPVFQAVVQPFFSPGDR